MNWFLGIRASDGVLAADFEDNATGANHSVAGTTPVTSDVWHHAAATYDGTTWRLYLDGASGSTSNIGTFTPRSDSIQHAALASAIDSSGVTAGFFDGRLDEARVWNVARTQGQIATARDLQLTFGSGLVARWGMNEGSGPLLTNSVAGGPSGSAVGGPVWVPGAPFAAGTDPAPAAPTGLTATPGAGRIDLAWNANSESDLAGYNIYRDTIEGGATVTTLSAGDIASCSSAVVTRRQPRSSTRCRATSSRWATTSTRTARLRSSITATTRPGDGPRREHCPHQGITSTRPRTPPVTTATSAPPRVTRPRVTTATTTARGTSSCSTATARMSPAAPGALRTMAAR